MLKLLEKLRGFARRDEASMTTQVVIFSVLLFGTTGLVIDFGRVYAEHSKMQTYVDAMALAAAQELDQREDSIVRANAAIFGTGNGAPIGKATQFSRGEADVFQIAQVIYLWDLPDDRGSQHQVSDISDAQLAYGTTDPLRARYVIVNAEQRNVVNSLLRLVNIGAVDDGGVSNAGIPNATPIAAIAIAGSERRICGPQPVLTICNPWEGSDLSFETATQDFTDNAHQFLVTATGDLDEENRLGLNVEAVNALTPCLDPGIGGFTPSLPGDAGSTAIDRCALAVRHDQLAETCVAPTMLVRPVGAEAAATGINTIFDMWDAPFDEILDPLQDVVISSVIGDMDRSDYFQPDAAGIKGLTYYERLTGVPGHTRQNYYPPIYYAGPFGAVDTLYDMIMEQGDPDTYYPDGVPIEYQSYRWQVADNPAYIRTLEPWANLCLHHPGINCPDSDAPTVSGPVDQSDVNSQVDEYYGTNYPFLLSEPGQFGELPEDVDTFYDVYLEERGEGVMLDTDWSDFINQQRTATEPSKLTYWTPLNNVRAENEDFPYQGPAAPGDANFPDPGGVPYPHHWAWTGMSFPPVESTLFGFQNEKMEPEVYLASYPSGFDETVQRRLFPVAVVNCQSMRRTGCNDDTAGDGCAAGVSNLTETYEAEVVDVVEMFLLRPVSPAYMAARLTTGICSDGTITCDNAGLSESRLLMEYVGPAEENEAEFVVRTTTTLTR